MCPPGVFNCYAERVAGRFSGPGQPYEGLAVLKTIHGQSECEHDPLNAPSWKEARWTGKVRLIEEHLQDPLHWTKPRMIFVNSMSDLFHEQVKNEWIDMICAVMALCPLHTFQCLTKRPERMKEYCTDPKTRSRIALAIFDLALELKTPKEGRPLPLVDRPDSTVEQPAMWVQWPLPNVWWGVSVEEQDTADMRIPYLMDMPAARRWVSYEPALGPLTLRPDWMPLIFGRVEVEPGIDWLVVGGESGPGAREMQIEWALDVKRQCERGHVAFFFKQGSETGEYAKSRHYKILECFPPELRVREYPQFVKMATLREVK